MSLYFENRACGRCGHRLAFLPEKVTLSAIEGDIARSLPPRGRALFLGRAGARRQQAGSLPRSLRRRFHGLQRSAAAPLRRRPAAGLAAAVRVGLCDDASLGGFRGDLGALPPHRRHARDGLRVRHGGTPARGSDRRIVGTDRLRSLSDREFRRDSSRRGRPSPSP